MYKPHKKMKKQSKQKQSNRELDWTSSVGTDNDFVDPELDETKYNSKLISISTKFVSKLKKQVLSGSLEDLELMLVGLSRATTGAFPPDICGEIINASLEVCFKAFERLLVIDSLDYQSVVDMPKSGNWENLRIYIGNFFRSIVNLLLDGAEDMIERITQLGKYIPYLYHVQSVKLVVLKKLLLLWFNESEVEISQVAFLRIFQLIQLSPSDHQEELLGMVFSCYEYNWGLPSNQAKLRPSVYLVDSIIVLCKISPPTSYVRVYGAIRKLAQQLKSVVAADNLMDDLQDRILTARNVSSLHMWARVVASLHPLFSDFEHLAKPLVEMISSIICLTSNDLRYEFVGIEMMTSLQVLAEQFQFFLPVSSNFFSLLENTELLLMKAIVPPTIPFDTNVIFLPSGVVRNPQYWNAVIESVATIVEKEIELYQQNAGFPEYAQILLRKLRNFAKKVKPLEWRERIRNTITKIEVTITRVKKARSEMKESPLSVVSLHTFPMLSNVSTAKISVSATNKKRKLH